MNVCHDVQHAESRPRVPKWLSAAPWHLPASPALAAVPAPSSPAQYAYGWKHDVKLAWRQKVCRAGKKTSGSERQMCHEVRTSGDQIIAVWHESGGGEHLWQVSGVASSSLDLVVRAAAPKVFWQGVHCETQNKIVVKHKNDHHVAGVAVVMDQGKQVFYIIVRLCVLSHLYFRKKQNGK